MTPYEARYSIISKFVDGMPSAVMEVMGSIGTYPENPGGLSPAEILSLSASAAKIKWNPDTAVLEGPTFKITLQVEGETESSFSSGSIRRYIYRGYAEVECHDTNKLGERVLFAMADAVEKCLENCRLTSDGITGSVALFSSRRTELTSESNSKNLIVIIPVEFADRR